MQQGIFFDQSMFQQPKNQREERNMIFLEHEVEKPREFDLFGQFFENDHFQHIRKAYDQGQNIRVVNNSYLSNNISTEQEAINQPSNQTIVERQQKQTRAIKKRTSTLVKGLYKQVDSSFGQSLSLSQSAFLPALSNHNSSETKNIPKNFVRGIVTFILGNQNLLLKVMAGKDTRTVVEFKEKLLRLKKNIKTIKGIRQMWSEEKNPFAKEIRILSAVFLRKYCLPYIFNSRIKNHALNIKYRAIMLKNLKNPKEFTCLKEF